MLSRLCILGVVLTAITSSGCVGWGPNGCEQVRGPFRGVFEGLCSTCGENCCNCDGYNPPFGNIRRTLACGSGCGEIYYGDWVSNPPNSCNECDARGTAYGINSRFPWLCNSWRFFWFWRPLGVRYGARGGYGNPLRGVHPGWGDYGWRPGMLADPCGCGSCETGCDSGCLNGDCAPNAPSGALQPIPNHSASARRKVSNSMQVNYESPLIRSSRMRRASALGGNANAGSAPALPSLNGPSNSSSRLAGRVTRTSGQVQVSNNGANYGRLKRPNSLR